MPTATSVVTSARPLEPADVLLADGRLGVIRPLQRDDGPAIFALHEQTSPDNLRLRFFNVSPRAARGYAEHVLEDPSVLALVAETHGRVVGLATAEPTEPGSADVSLLVADDVHGRGLGTLLLEHLAALARDRGIWRFEAEVLVENHAMLRVLADAGSKVTGRPDRGVITVHLGTSSTPELQDAADRREFLAESRSLAPLLAPRSVAVAGVRSDGTGVGAAVLRSILANGFSGDLFVVHPSRRSIDGIVAHRTFADLPLRVDLAVLAVPAETAEAALADAAAAGVPAAVVISSGFGELGEAGAELQGRLARVARGQGIRLVGPNCLGVLANDPAIRLNATFHAQRPPRAGGLAVASQSGGVGIVLLDRARQLGLGVRSFVSLGNAADVSSNDLLAAWYDEPEVTAAALYLESFGNARKFARFARRFSQRKPLLAVVGGRSSSGQRGGASHTAAAASSQVAVQALFAQAGVIACTDADDLAETALLLTEQPLPRGSRVGVVSNAGGIGILIADAAEEVGLHVPPFSPALQARVGEHVLGTSGTTNPVDAGAAVTPEQMGEVLRAVLGSGEVDAVVAAVVATGVTDGVAVVRRMGEVRAQFADVPVQLVTLGGLDVGDLPGLTTHASAAAAVRALSHAVGYVRWLAVPVAPVPTSNPAHVRAVRAEAQAVLSRKASTDTWLDVTETRDLLDRYGLHVLGEVATGVDAAVSTAERIGFPAAVKLANAGPEHKTEKGLVRIGLTSAESVHRAVADFERLIGAKPEVLVQPMVTGVELALGVVRDPAMGALVMVAAGGVATYVWGDRVFLLPPFSAADARHAIRGLRLFPLLNGFRGGDPVDVDALEQLIVDLGRLVTDVPEVAELDLNPVFVSPGGCAVVDVRLRLTTVEDATLPPSQLRRSW
jgi:acyl-CoA synthetase (NDP forming)/GNAT superfamily N-acetyltransferase